MIRITNLMVCLAVAGAALLGAVEQAGRHLLLVGNYKFDHHNDGPQQMAAVLQVAGLGTWTAQRVMNDIHADLAHNWHGEQAADGSWKKRPRTGEDLIRGTTEDAPRPSALLLQFRLGSYADKRQGEAYRAALAGYLDLAREAGVRVLLLVEPGDQVIGPVAEAAHPGEKIGRYTTGDTWRAGMATLWEQDREQLRAIAREHQVEIVPLPGVFLRFHAEHPELDLHAPTPWNDRSHLSPSDCYLSACAVAAALGGELPEQLPSGPDLLPGVNQRITRDNVKRRAKGEPERAPLGIDPLLAQAAATSAWAAMAEWRALQEQVLGGSPITR